MNAQKAKLRKNEFAEFWSNFRLSHWGWMHTLVTQSRYLASWVLSVGFMLAYLTFIPDGSGFRILPLKHYGSINLILLAMISIVFLTIRWHHRIPVFFQWLWESGRLEARDGELGSEFERYLHEYQTALSSRKEPLAVGLLLVVLFLAISVWAGVFRFLFDFFTLPAAVLLTVQGLFGFFSLFLLGQAGWIAFVTGRQIANLSRLFRIKIQPRHPDRCGGLKAFGDFCLDAALPLVVGGLILAIVPTLYLLGLRIDLDDVLMVMAVSVLVVFFTPLTLISVFVPLWQIHVAMTGEKMNYEDAYASQAMELENIILEHTTEKGDLKKAAAAKEKLEILQTVNPKNNPYPVWPFPFTTTVLALLSPQLLQTIAGAVYEAYEIFFGN